MPPARRTTSKTTRVDKTVKNQEEPFAHSEERPTTETTSTPEVAKAAPAHEVDDTVKNQESPGAAEPVDRNPGQQIVANADGITYDVSKSYPELVQDSEEEKARKAKFRQDNAVLDARDQGSEDKKYIEIEFLSTGLTAKSRVWKAGEVLRLEDTDLAKFATASTDGKLWYEMTDEEQQKRFGRLMFKKR